MALPARAAPEVGRRPGAPVLLALAAAVGSGALLALQQRVNGELQTALDDAVLTALVSSGTGLGVVAVAVLARPAARPALRALRELPRWQLAGGLCGALLVTVAAAAAPVLGVALLTVGLVAGQTAGALAVDRWGLGPGSALPVSTARLLGAFLCVLAVAVGASAEGARQARPALLVLVLVAGCLIAVQQALNGRVARAAGDAGVATLVNFAVAALALVAALFVSRLLLGSAQPSWPGTDRWFLYSGGAMGVVLIAVAAAVVRRLGVLRLGLAVTAGQLTGALLLDLALPVADTRVDPRTVVGVVLTFAAVAVSARSARR